MNIEDLKRAATVGAEDLVMLTQMTDKAILENLKLRYDKDLIYTNIGNVLISINPFQRLPLYTEEQIQYFKRHGRNTTTPHIFALAEDTYRTMVMEEEHQCVIISGESGAGKTEASKQIMQYVAAVSGDSKEMQRVKTIMLESNPLLESFGNAKTVRNDNSSRFGKFFEIYFDKVGGPVGGKMSNFLLEKSRVVYQQAGERNFHVFYQLCAGADPSLKTKLRLKSAGEFFYLKQGGVLERPGVNDQKEHEEMVDAMEAIGIPSDEIEQIFELLAAILHLGEIKFHVVSGEEHGVTNKEDLVFVCELLKMDAVALERAFTWKKLNMGGEVVDVPLDIQQCTNARDALAKTIYDKLFDYVVMTINLAFGKKPYALMLGVLDIYGFEIFNKNGFEQFCINYVNEKLQQIFIELTLKREQEEYVKEKIAWQEIKYFNNKVVCDLIEGKNPPGLFSLFDDVCATMAKEKESVADIKMLDKLDAVHFGNQHYKRTETGFRIQHYAGEVQYTSAGFTNRNKDLLSPDIMKVVYDTKNGFLSELISSIEVDVGDKGSGGGAKKKSTTAGFKIRQQAADLVATLTKCTPHYVRTVKPNDQKKPNLVDDQRLLHQIKYLGLLENVRVRRAGFAYRQHFEKFLKRFKYTCPLTFPRPFRGSDKDACKAILKHCAERVPEDGWQLGETKLFIKAPQSLFAMEDAREESFDSVVRKIQRAWNKFRNNKEYIMLKKNNDKIYAKAGKERRADSVFRPMQGEYIQYRRDLEHIHHLVEYDPITSAWSEHYHEGKKRYFANAITGATTWTKPPELDQQRIIFTDKVERVVDHNAGTKVTETIVITDRGLFLTELQNLTITPPKEKPTKQNPKPVQPQPYTITKNVLKKKLDLRCVSGVSVSLQADPVCIIHMYPAAIPYRPVHMVPVKGTTHCVGCGSKFTAKDKKQNCPGCGNLFKVSCLPEARAFPTLGAPKPTMCCPHCAASAEAEEPVEDIVLWTPMKSEIVAMVRKVYKKVMGSKIPININNSIPYQLHGEANQRTANFMLNPDLKEAALYTQPGQLVIHAGKGIDQAKIQSIEAEKEKRAKDAQERMRREAAEEKEKEARKEAEREAERKRQVEERKKAKAEMAEKADAERQARERERAAQKEASARTVAARANR